MSKANPTPAHVPIDSAAKPLGRGAIIGRYVVLGLVGRGGMGEVYAAYDPELDRKVAVKLLRVKAGNGVSLTEGRQRTLREAQAIARLSDPNVVVVYDVGTFEDKVFIAMEFVEGNTVTFWLEQKPRIWQEILRVFIAAGRGLTAAHAKGLVHRDFKPDNVMVGRDGQVRVMDFGLARQMDKPGIKEHRVRPASPVPRRLDVEVGTGTLPLEHRAVPIDQGTLLLNNGQNDSGAEMQSSVSGLFDARLTRTGAMMGTPAYMAPEQFFGKETDSRTDQFSFCVALYEALYGERPFPGKKLTELTANVVQGTIRAAPAGTKVPFWVRRILLRGLRSAPVERYPSMAEMLAALGKDPRVTHRKWAVWAAVALVPVVVGLGVRQSLIDRRALCDGAGEKLAGIWDLHPPDQPEGPRQSQIHAAFMRTGKSYAADVYETVTRALTGYAQNWTTMYKQTCEATQIRHEQSEEVLDLRMSCLNERLNGFRALTDVFADATGEVVENAVSASNALSTLDRCADVPTLRAVIKPPDDPTTAAQVAEMRRRLAKTKAHFDSGRWKETLKEAPALVSQARTLGYQPLLAESLGLTGLMYYTANDARAAEKALVEAYRLADASRHDEVRAEVATNLVFVTGYQERHFDDASEMVRGGGRCPSTTRRTRASARLATEQSRMRLLRQRRHRSGATCTKGRTGAQTEALGCGSSGRWIVGGKPGVCPERDGSERGGSLTSIERSRSNGKRLGAQHPDLGFPIRQSRRDLERAGASCRGATVVRASRCDLGTRTGPRPVLPTLDRDRAQLPGRGQRRERDRVP